MGYLCCCEITGTTGVASWNFKERKAGLYRSEDKTWHDYSDRMAEDINTMYVEELSHFLSCVDEKKRTCNTVSDAARVLKVALDDGTALVG
jgi:predicted dehydrogenase